jgi:hypothetical protein
MGFLSRVKGAVGGTPIDQNPTDEQQPQSQPAQTQTNVVANNEKVPAEDEMFSDNAQAGVQKVEAAAMVWDKKHLIAAYAL